MVLFQTLNFFRNASPCTRLSSSLEYVLSSFYFHQASNIYNAKTKPIILHYHKSLLPIKSYFLLGVLKCNWKLCVYWCHTEKRFIKNSLRVVKIGRNSLQLLSDGRERKPRRGKLGERGFGVSLCPAVIPPSAHCPKPLYRG